MSCSILTDEHAEGCKEENAIIVSYIIHVVTCKSFYLRDTLIIYIQSRCPRVETLGILDSHITTTMDGYRRN